jgi:murein hydrolase activator
MSGRFLPWIALVQAMPVPKLKLILEGLFEAVKATSSRALTRTLTASNRRVLLEPTGRWFKRVKAAKRLEEVALRRLNQLQTIEASFCVSRMITKSDLKPLPWELENGPIFKGTIANTLEPALQHADDPCSETVYQFPMRAFKAISLSLLTLCFALPASRPAHGQSSAEQELKRLETEKATREKRVGALVDTANKAAIDAENLRRRLVAAATARDRLEREVESTEIRLIRMRRSEREASAKLMANRAALEDVVIALIAMERDRPPALAVRPDNAAEAARAAILMGEVAPILEGRARQAAQDIVALRNLRQTILLQNDRYREANQRLQSARQTIGALIEQRRALQARLLRDAQTERGRIAEIVRRASDLRDLVTRLGGSLPGLDDNQQSQGPAFASGFERARGQVAYPAIGRIVTGFGSRLDEGGRSEGITIRTRRAAQVVSPYDGEIEFAGPFRSYGRVLIINVGNGYHVVLAGLASTFAEAGQEILAGEPIGEMANDSRIIPDLYMEVRQASEPRDPTLWLKRPEGT